MTVLRCDRCQTPVLLLTDQRLRLVEQDPERYVYLCLTCSGERDG